MLVCKFKRKGEGCMPFNSKNKNARNNGSRKTESILKTIYKRYNPEKVTIQGLKNFIKQVMKWKWFHFSCLKKFQNL